MKLYYIKFGNYEPEEIVTGYFTNKEVAEKVLDYLTEKSDHHMYEIGLINTDHQVFETFEEWFEHND